MREEVAAGWHYVYAAVWFKSRRLLFLVFAVGFAGPGSLRPGCKPLDRRLAAEVRRDGACGEAGRPRSAASAANGEQGRGAQPTHAHAGEGEAALYVCPLCLRCLAVHGRCFWVCISKKQTYLRYFPMVSTYVAVPDSHVNCCLSV